MNTLLKFVFFTSLLILNLLVVADEIPEEFKIKRKNNFEFASKPKITKDKKGCSITFETKDYCDVTIVVEDSTSKIIRHLASGILGNNPPAPFAKNTKKQSIIWDGKDDLGKYRDDFENLNIRVSLGLKPEFEKTLFWSPHKRIGKRRPLFAANSEGVFVFEAEGVDSLKQFDHDGNYIKTIYPFSSKKISQIKGLESRIFLQDGKSLPIKHGPKHRSTLLRSGDNMLGSPGKYGAAANTLSINKNNIALVSLKIGRLLTSGLVHENGILKDELLYITKTKSGKDTGHKPYYSVFSNDGKTLYYSGVLVPQIGQRPWEYVPGVYRVDYHNKSTPILFKGSADVKKVGNKNDQFKVNLGLAVDAQDRLYVADYMNDRIQVFKPDGTFLKSLKVKRPVKLGIDKKTGKIYVCSYMIVNRFIKGKLPANISILTSYDNPKIEFKADLPLVGYNPKASILNRKRGLEFSFGFDFFHKKPRLWMLPGLNYGIGNYGIAKSKKSLKGSGVLICEFGKNKLKIIKDFHPIVTKKITRSMPPILSRQRLYVDPKEGDLFVAEGDSGVMKSFKQLIKINANNAKVSKINLPMTSEDMAIGLDGYFYLRSEFYVMRFDPKTWKEIPFDYGVEQKKVGFDKSAKSAKAISIIKLPSTGKPGWFHLGGMAISPKGHLVLSCCNNTSSASLGGENFYSKRSNKLKNIDQYISPTFPGRRKGWELHVWDKYGKLIYKNAFKGVVVTDGVNMDKDDNLYVLISQGRKFNGKKYTVPWAETMVKVKAGKGKLMTTFRPEIPFPKSDQPKRKMDVVNSWVENADWFYGGVGFNGLKSGRSCICWNARPALDLLARSFLPEIDHFSIAVLDSNGNLITRIGQYGNVDDGKPLVNAGGPKKTNSIGGDEVALFHAAYVATHTDKRLFIADAGNSRILSVKLNYHTNSSIPLKNMANKN